MPPSYSQPAGQNPFESRATTILVLGIVGLVVCPILAPIAWVMGNGVRRDAAAAGWPEPGTAKAGRILGMVYTLIWVVVIVISIILTLVLALASN